MENRNIHFIYSSRRERLKRAVALLCAIVLFLTMNTLKRSADTLERIPTCGFEEHTHEAACYDDAGDVICGFEEHTHTDACFQESPVRAEPVEPTVDAQELALESDSDVEDAEVPAEDAGNAAEASAAFNLSEPILFSEIAMNLPLRTEEVIEVAPVEDSEAQAGLVGVEALEGDWLIYALQDFERAELAVVTQTDVLTLTLAEGRAQRAEPTEVVDETEDGTDAPEGLSFEEESDAPEAEEIPEIEQVEAPEPEEDVIPEETELIEEEPEEAPEADEEESAEAPESEEVPEADEEEPAEAPESEEAAEADAEEPAEAPETGEVPEADAEEPAEAPGTEEVPEADAEESAEAPEAGEAPEEDAEESAEAPTVAADDAPAAQIYIEHDFALNGDEAVSLRALIESAEGAGAEAPAASEPEAADVAAEEPAEPQEAPVEAEEIAGDIAEAGENLIEVNPIEADAAEESPIEDDIIEASPVEAAPAEATAELGTAPAAVAYDADLVDVAAVDDDYIVTPVADFERTEVTWGRYVFTLLNGRAPVDYPAQSFEGTTEFVSVSVTAEAGAFPAGTVMTVADIEDADTIDGITEKVEEGFVRVERVHAVDISFFDAEGVEIEPLIPISVVMTVREIEEDRETVVVHVDADAQAEIIETAEDAPSDGEGDFSVGFVADAFSVYSLVVAQRIDTKVIAADGNTYAIEVTYAEDAHIPAGATLDVTEVTGDGQYLAQARENLAGNRLITLARFFDIKIMDGENEVHPDAPVEVRIWLDGKPDDAAQAEADDAAQAPEEAQAEAEAQDDAHTVVTSEPAPSALHFTEDEDAAVAETSARESEDAVVFRADGFSVWGVVYTVDFYYGNYEWHIDGGSSMSLRALLEKLDITDDARSFVASIDVVEFSNPELLAVVPVDEDTTVGAIRAALGVETQYSAELTEEDINAIEETPFERGDWALISLQPFASHETLTLTLRDGNVYVVDVFDAAYTNNTNTQITIKVNNANYGTISTNGNKVTEISSNVGNTNIIRVNNGTDNRLTGYNRDSITAESKDEDKYAFAYWKDNGVISTVYTKNKISGDALDVQNYSGTLEAVFGEIYHFTIVNKTPEGGKFQSKYADTANNNANPVDVTTPFSGRGRLTATEKMDNIFSWGFPTTANENYKFAFWCTDEGQYFPSIDSGSKTTIIPKDNTTFNGYFVPSDRNLILYFTGDGGTIENYASVGGVNNIHYSTETTGAKAVPNSGYNFLGWYDQNGDLVSINPTFDPQKVDDNMVVTARFAPRGTGNTMYFENVGDGAVTRQENGQLKEYKDMSIESNGTFKVTLTATPTSESAFLYWELERTMTIDGVTTTHTLIFDESHQTLKSNDQSFFFVKGDKMIAHYGKATPIYTNDAPASGLTISESRKTTLQDWLDKLEEKKTLTAKKTAQVYDYDNRIYQVNLEAESTMAMLSGAIDMAFIIDVSNSMKFPSGLTKNGDFMVLTQDNLNAKYPDGGPVYIISDPKMVATVYKIFREPDGLWYYDDASHLDNEGKKLVKIDNVYSDPEGGWPYSYPIYTVSDSKLRKAYLNEAMSGTIDTMHNIIDTIKKAGSAPSIRVAYNEFASYLVSDHETVGHDFTTLESGDNYTIQVEKTAGGTRQDLALEDAESFSWDSTHTKYAILITDGAPNLSGKQDWVRGEVEAKAKALTDAGVKLITVGLSTQNEPDGSALLKRIASEDTDGKLFFEAENASELKYILLDILERMMKDHIYVSGTVSDVVDSAFYPVWADGTPVEEGWYSADGTKLNISAPTGAPVYHWYKVGDVWHIDWYNQIFGWEDNAGYSKWSKSIYLKAKEDFLGGNKIPTNVYAQVQPYWYWDTTSNAWVSLKDPVNPGNTQYVEPATQLASPHVNVDELHLTQESTRWKVYLGTEVDPQLQLTALWNDIVVKQVVKANGTRSDSNGTLIADKSQMFYAHGETVDAVDEAEPSSGYASLPISRYFSTEKFTALVNQLDSNTDSAEETIDYTAYGHTPGTITVKVEKAIASGAVAAAASAPASHVTDLVGDKVEEYTITVTYTPSIADADESYEHTPSDGSAGKVTNPASAGDKVESTNKHIIDVFVKKLKIKKVNEDLQRALTGAKFRLYRTALESERNAADCMTINGVVCVPASDEITVDSNGIADIGAVKYAAGADYYLVETVAPAGYIAAAPMAVTLTIHDDPATRQGAYNWTQTASLTLASPPAVRSTAAWANASEPELDSSTDYVYYRIPNNPGYALPSTGGAGTVIFYAAGSMLVLAAAVLLIVKRRMGSGE